MHCVSWLEHEPVPSACARHPGNLDVRMYLYGAGYSPTAPLVGIRGTCRGLFIVPTRFQVGGPRSGRIGP